MKRALIYLSVVALALAAIYWSVNRLSHFVDADDASGTPEAAVAEQPTIAPPPTLEPSPIVPSPLPPTTVIVPTVVQPTIAPPTAVPPTEVLTIVPATEVPTLVVATEVAAPTDLPTLLLVDAAPTTEMPAPTQVIEPTGVPPTDALVPTDSPPTLEPAITAEMTVTRGAGLETTPVINGGQSSVDSPVEVPPTTEPVLLPTATIFELQPTVVATIEQPTIEASPAPPTAIPSVAPSPNPDGTPMLAVVTGTVTAPSAVNLTLTLPDGSTVTGVTEADGSFVFPNLQPGAYHLEASAEGFLTSGIYFTLADGQNYALPPAVLTAGDTNADNVIDVRDAVLIAANFGGPPVSQATDLNGDGWIDIRDLAIIGAVFGESGPVPWG